MFFLFFLAIFLSALMVLAGLILAVVGLSSNKPKTRNGGFITFGVGAIALLCSIYFAVTTVVAKVKEKVVEPFGNLIDSLDEYSPQANDAGLLNDNRFYLLEDTCSNPEIKFIKEESKLVSGAIPNSFYTYFGTSGFARMPLIYPYAIHCWDSKDNGTLVNEENVVDMETAPEGEENVVFNISAINYDRSLIMMRISSPQNDTNRDLVSYILYGVKDKKSKEYKTEAELFKAATKAGYKGEKVLVSLWDYDVRF
ncbi:MAG: hypothetical protein Q8M29_00125 [Bacteroidota bacterium]|nr:hypothetical protein [Bacteroidota bacterium]